MIPAKPGPDSYHLTAVGLAGEKEQCRRATRWKKTIKSKIAPKPQANQAALNGGAEVQPRQNRAQTIVKPKMHVNNVSCLSTAAGLDIKPATTSLKGTTHNI